MSQLNEGLLRITLMGRLYEDLSEDGFWGVGETSSGRSLMARHALELLLSSSAIEEYRVVSNRHQLAEKLIRPIHPDDLRSITANPGVIWFEPARHGWWRAAAIRRVLGAVFPIVTMAHGLNYPYLLTDLIASMSLGARPGDVVIVPSAAAAEVFSGQLDYVRSLLREPEAPGPSVRIVPYSPPVTDLVDRAEARSRLGWSDCHIHAVMIGRLAMSDKFDYVATFEAVSRARNLCPHLRVDVCGFGSPEDEQAVYDIAVRLGVGDVVNVSRNVDELRKSDILSAADFCLATSNTTSESFGLVLVEAMRAGLPVVATDWSGYKDLIEDGGSGFLVRTIWSDSVAEVLSMGYLADRLDSSMSPVAVDIPMLTRRLVQIVQSGELRVRFSRRARQLSELYSPGSMTAALVAVFNDSLGGRDRPDQVDQPMDHGMVELFGRFASMRFRGEPSEFVGDRAADAERIYALSQALPPMSHYSPGELQRFELLRRGVLDLDD